MVAGKIVYEGDPQTFIHGETGFRQTLIPKYEKPRKKFPGPFMTAFMKTLVKEMKTPHSAHALLWIFIDSMNEHNRCIITVEKIIKQTNIAKRTIAKHYAYLKEKNFIKHKRGCVMVSPALAVKCTTEEYEELVAEWNVFGTSEDDYDERIVLTKKNQKEYAPDRKWLDHMTERDIFGILE